jgi:hypothetical protein
MLVRNIRIPSFYGGYFDLDAKKANEKLIELNTESKVYCGI